MPINDLYQRSIQIILQNQSPSGASIASPNFLTYAYCWLRDGSFIAHAMDRTGQPGYTDGPAAQAQFRLPQGIPVDSKGIIYVADTGNNCIRKITPEALSLLKFIRPHTTPSGVLKSELAHREEGFFSLPSTP